MVRTTGGKLDCKAANKAAKFVRFCDAFSIPVITFVDCDGFEGIKAAAKLTSAYAEATTAKISVVVGKAVGSAYIALAGTGANADVVYAAVADKFAQEKLSAFNAAQNGYVDGIVEFYELRAALLSALEMLSGKRVPTVAKKHSTI